MHKAACTTALFASVTFLLIAAVGAQDPPEGSGQPEQGATPAETASETEHQADEPSGEAEEESDTGLPTWRPRTGTTRPAPALELPSGQEPASGSELTDRPLRPTREAEQDDRPELLVFDLYFDDGVRFSDTYRTRLERAFLSTVQENQSYRLLTPHERRRRLTEASQLVGNEVSDDYGEGVAAAIEAEYYVVPRILVEDSRSYLISVTFGRAGGGAEQRVVARATSNRVVDNVQRQLVRLTEQALSSTVD
ncbi:MAG: hypothetical protein JW797_00835 [Bradymonadales bacterium]|nr:hypothetical protein [Bradymonadales bacterium]